MNQTKLLFIDSKVENYNYLISQVDPQTKVVILQPNKNGIDQISKTLDECCDVDTVHLISHGTKGTLYLGNSIVNSENIHLYIESIQQWGKCLSAEAEILIYGCQVASGKEGKEFVRQLHQLTGANIAASETLTGNVNKGGNWNLEVIFGQLKSALAFTPEVRASYAGVLANIVVDTTNDVVDDNDGVTSLREAIIEANSTPEDDTIQLTAGATYNLTISGSDEDAAATGDLDILAGGGEITVISEGEEKAVIDAGGETGINDRVFHILEDAVLQLENLEVTGGRVSGDGGGINNLGIASINNSTIAINLANNGGGINNSGTVSISNSTITSNSNNSGGGGIHNFLLGIANISDSTISNNSAISGGGILNNTGTVSINNSTISNNSANTGSGGGILNLGTTDYLLGIINITNSTITGNLAESGGGIYNLGTTNINDSTISGNSAFSSSGNSGSAYGGGIYNSNGNLTISNSNISGNSSDFDGGGISNTSDGTSNISNSTISNNSGSFGGGISNSSGTVDISDSTISDNSANFGGGLYNNDTATIDNSTISGNSAGRNGGGIYNFRGTPTINNSTISENSAGGRGGAIHSFAPVDGITINNSTISSNSAVESGAGIYNVSSFSSISNSTITLNETISNQGSGIFHSALGFSNIVITSSIVSGNTNIDVEIAPSDTGNTFTSGNNNLIGTGIGIDSFNGDRDQVGVTNPLLGELTDNGGPTLTHLPLPNSPAIDAGSNPNLLTTDQRGEPRLAGAGVDIGAVELQPIQEIIGTAEADFLNGTTGQDSIFGLDGNDVINGLDNNDVLFGNRDLDTLNGDAGNDTIFGGRDEDLVFGNIGEDFLRGDRGSDSIFGQEDNDTIFGGRDNDFVDGGFGDDSISGDLGRDTLIGGQGIDTLTGGDDVDIFELAVGEGLDIIADFTNDIDLIQLPDFLTFSDLEINPTEDNSTLITVASNGEELALLNNVSALSITETDFV